MSRDEEVRVRIRKKKISLLLEAHSTLLPGISSRLVQRFSREKGIVVHVVVGILVSEQRWKADCPGFIRQSYVLSFVEAHTFR